MGNWIEQASQSFCPGAAVAVGGRWEALIPPELPNFPRGFVVKENLRQQVKGAGSWKLTKQVWVGLNAEGDRQGIKGIWLILCTTLNDSHSNLQSLPSPTVFLDQSWD